MRIPRRRFIGAIPAAGLGLPFVNRAALQDASLDGPPPLSAPDRIPESYPTHEAALVRKVVGLSHSDLAGVRALVEAYPSLAKAAWDWGYGDWETALGAAAHTGRREIAELLIANGAPPTVFSAAMLGQVDVVEAFVSIGAAAATLPGPHGIPLIAHARAGGPQAAAVVTLLESLVPPAPAARVLSAEESAALAGRYRFGTGPRDVFVVEDQRNGLFLTRVGAAARRLFPRDDGSFHPAGTPAVRVRFAEPRTLTITDGPRVIVATAV